MADDSTTRRRFIETSAAAAVLGLAGCSQNPTSDSTTEQPTSDATTGTTTSSSTTTANETTTAASQNFGAIDGPKYGDDLPEDTTSKDGLPPEFDVQLEDRSVDTSSFETETVGEFEIPLVPVDVAYYWYLQGETRFADARSEPEYGVSHVLGAVLSPALDHTPEDDPVYDWPKGDRVVTYCDCPHHLSTIRAADLRNRGWENVFALKDGYSEWQDARYPMAGSDPTRSPKVWTVRGETRTMDAGKDVWVYDVNSSQKEGSEIRSDGTYEVNLAFVDVSGDSKVRVETPTYTVTATLRELQGAYVTINGGITTDTPTPEPKNSTTTNSTTTNSTTSNSSSLLGSFF